VVGWTTAIVFVLEVVIIDVQAWRGTASHFNVSTTLDMVLFFVMGAAILLQTLVSVAIGLLAPMTPLLFLEMPLNELLLKLGHALFVGLPA